MSLPIIFYDIPSTLPGNAWSPNTWKTRYALNIKGVPYKTEWVEYPDIERVAKTIGAPATDTKADGSPLYTLPMISDPNTGRVVADSFLIAQYLDATYPTTGAVLIPRGTAPLMRAFEAGVVGALGSIIMQQLATSCAVLNPPSERYFCATREARFGKKMEEFSPPGPGRAEEWAKAREGLAGVQRWLASRDGGKYVMGETVSYADAILGAWLVWIKITQGAESAVWKDIASWHGGEWAAHLAALGIYAKL